ncbi:hypothetical protein LCGC14_2909440 [marine sediment metagenome]|uniref:Uncharacterized protein n=1 Tax=marine sediment metagenome TaxID=412755 RepID=A0A0F8XSH9_9ZZZZ
MKREHDGKGNSTTQQDKCPACGSKKRVFERLSEEAVELGAAPPGFKMGYQATQQIVGDPEWQAKQPMGGKVPVGGTVLDICYDCHALYAPVVHTGKAVKAPTPKKLVVPGQG